MTQRASGRWPRSIRARALSCVAGGVVAAVATISLAADDDDQPRVKITWVLAPDLGACPNRDLVNGEVAAELGYDPFGPNPAIELEVRVSRDGPRFVGEIRRIDGPGQKTETSTSCEELGRIMAFDIALLVRPPRLPFPSLEDAGDASASLDASATAPQDAPSDSATASPVEPLDASSVVADAAVFVSDAAAPIGVDAAPPAAPDSDFQLRVGLAGGAFYSPAARAHLGGSAEIGARWSELSVSLEARMLVLREGTDGGSAPLGASMMLGSIYPCLHRGFVVACGALALGTLTLTRPSEERTSFYGGAGARMGVEVPIADGVHLTLRGDVLLGPRPVSCRDEAEDGRCDVPTAEIWSGSAFSGGVSGGVLADF